MAHETDLYDSTYGHFAAQVLAAVRADTHGTDIGQNSWTSAAEYARLADWLALGPASRVLEVACGSGGPALHLVRTRGCHVTGIDANARGIATATEAARAAALADRTTFRLADAAATLPFDDGAFDALVCIDALNHLPDRLAVLREWKRVLRPGGRAAFTDPVVLHGPVTAEEIARRSSIGAFLFVAPGVNEQLVEQAGLTLAHTEDTSASAASVASRWRRAREARREDLERIEGAERFSGLQSFLASVESSTRDGRLRRITYFAERAGG